MPRKRKEEVTIEPGKGLNLDPELIKQLVPGTLDRATINEQLAALKKAIFERALGGELTHHLGYEKGEAKPSDSTNHRNGTSRKRITTDDDLLDVEIPRDREGTFDPVLIAKGERRFTGFDGKIIAMYARGMSVREIQGFLLEMYGIEVSPDFISTVTDAVIDEVREWQQRPLEPMYPVTPCASRFATKAWCATRRSTWRSACAATAHVTCSASGSSRPRALSSGCGSSTT